MFKTIAAGVSAGAIAALIASAMDDSNKGWTLAAGGVAAVAASFFTRSTFSATLGVAVLGGGVAGMCASSFERKGTTVERLSKGFVNGVIMGLGCAAMITTAYGVLRVFPRYVDWLKTQQVIGWTLVNGQVVPIFGNKT